MATYANQSCTVADVLDALKAVLDATQVANARNVVEWNYHDRPSVDAAGPLVWFRWVGRKPDVESGAGRHGTKCDVLVEVNLTTRAFRDAAQRDKRIMRTHLANQAKLENALYGRFLHTAYSTAAGDDPPMPTQDATALTVGTMTAADLPAPERPRPEEGYVEARIGVRVPCVLRVTLDDVPAAEE